LLYAELGRTGDALRLYRQALDIWQRILPPGAPEIATTLNNLGALYAGERRYRDAVYYYRRALAIQAQPSTLNNLAEMYRAQGRNSEAERLYRRLIDALPPTDPTLGAALNNLGELCRRKGRPAEAAGYYRRALAVWDRTLGPDHPYRATTLRNLAELQKKQNGSAAVASFR
jgi:tetratricopeptide (TPR) repeat protein